MLDYRPFPFRSVPIGMTDVNGAFPLEGVSARMRRYELMLVIRPDVPDDRSQAVIDRVDPPDHRRWRPDRQGRPVGPPPARLPDRPVPRRLVPHRPVRRAGRRCWPSWSTASSSPRRSSGTCVTRDERPAKPSRREDGDAEGAEDGEDVDDTDLPSDLDEEDEDDVPERIGEDESEAAPAAID